MVLKKRHIKRYKEAIGELGGRTRTTSSYAMHMLQKAEKTSGGDS